MHSIMANIEWIFDGFGVAIITAAVTYFLRRRRVTVAIEDNEHTEIVRNDIAATAAIRRNKGGKVDGNIIRPGT